MHFAWPWMLLLLPLPWLVRRWAAPAHSAGETLFLPWLSELGNPAGAARAPRPVVLALLALAWLLLIGASARPQWLGDPVPVAQPGRTVLMAIDVSGSMAEQDMAGSASRLQVVQQVAGHFIDGRRGDQIGLLLFGTRPYVQAPITADLATVHRFLDDAVVGVAGTQTAIGDAIGMALKRLRALHDDGSAAAPEKRAVLILLTDGQNDAGVVPPLQAARLAAQQGLRVYTIGVGSDGGSGPFGLGAGSELDEATLKDIARLTGGEYFRATDAGALQSVYQRIDELEPVAERAQWLRPTDEWFSWPLGLALLLSLPAALRLAEAS
jgi:Ca-activated chloride channel homolog